uniref:Uncharacterized protein n=1 Tax=Prymnesium polylepis TaxID=72548 RepID=A0A6T7WHI5_9EUKA|mmetsp:Transcript_11484/g.28681  ORF Transcript_11484/g.28681 Transcript_11484/m.28681 type:complete len:243 (+) Transcript_11484:443-1171(+)
MRLCLHMQTQPQKQALIAAFHGLPEDVRKTLGEENGAPWGGWRHQWAVRNKRSGLLGLLFARFHARSTAADLGWGLQVLALVYRQSRQLWPISAALTDKNVTIRIDIIKSMTVAAAGKIGSEGRKFLICKRNELEGVVEEHPESFSITGKEKMYRAIPLEPKAVEQALAGVSSGAQGVFGTFRGMLGSASRLRTVSRRSKDLSSSHRDSAKKPSISEAETSKKSIAGLNENLPPPTIAELEA